MDFFKKILGGSGSKAAEEGGSEAHDAQKSAESQKEDHDKGHPSGNGGKNVCEFCEIPSVKRE